MRKMRHQLLCGIILFSFFIYAVSPLSIIYKNNDFLNHTADAIKGLRLLVIELLVSSVTQDDHEEETSDNKSVHFLLKKKRATLSKKNEILSKYGLKYLSVDNDTYRDIIILSCFAMIEPAIPDFSQDFYAIYSGLSPPCPSIQNQFC